MKYRLLRTLTPEVYERLLKVEPRLACFKPVFDELGDDKVLSEDELVGRITPHLAMGHTAEKALQSAFDVGLIYKFYTKEEKIQSGLNPLKQGYKSELDFFSTTYSFPDLQFFEDLEEPLNKISNLFREARVPNGKIDFRFGQIPFVLRDIRFTDEWCVSSNYSGSETTYTVMSPAVQLAFLAGHFKAMFPEGVEAYLNQSHERNRPPNFKDLIDEFNGLLELLRSMVKKLPQVARDYMNLAGISF